MTKKYLYLFVLLLVSAGAQAQSGVIKGRIFDGINNEPLEFATVRVQDQPYGAYSDENGDFEIKNVKPGLYNILVSYTGYVDQLIPEIQVFNSKAAMLEVGMEEENVEVEGVEITASPYTKTPESPVSLRTIGVNEIERNPGGNRDISKVIQSLPGVASTVAFRNDIIIRGGSPNENRFYLDGIEVPNINHFATQGASGGPVGLINVNFIREVDFYSGAFPSNRGNTLSSVMDIKLKNGRDDRMGFNATIGSSDLGITIEGPVEGPLGKPTTYMFSVRRSYLGPLFKVIGLPFLPNYNDFQFKSKTKFNSKNEMTIIGLGAIDEFALNLEADSTEQQKYILSYLPVQTQWNYTTGVNFRHFLDKGYLNFVVSRNMLNNRTFKYPDNDDSGGANPILNYTSQEMENKFRFEHTFRDKGFKVNYGVAYEYVRYLNDTYNRISTPMGIDTIDFSTALDFHKFGLFGQVSKSFMENRLSLSAGLRMDGIDYTKEMAKLWNTFSPRFSASFQITPEISANFNTGIYYQLPAYTVLGYVNEFKQVANRNPDLKYIRSKHLVAGMEYTNKINSKISVEGFFKDYDNYPFLLRDSISLANLGGDFGVVGNEPVTSTSEGRAYGMEVLLQQKMYKGFFGILAYTFVRSEFTDGSGEYKPSAWDNRHIITSTLGKKFKGNWEVGARWRFYGGTPYTPIDTDRSGLIPVWNITGRGLPDYSQLNSQRLPAAHQLDFRVDKKFYFERWSLNLYLDIQNAYNFQATGAPFFDVVRDDAGNPTPDLSNPGSYQTRLIDNTSGTVLPTVGIVIEL